MLRKMMERLLAAGIPVLYYIRLVGWRVLRPITFGVRAIVLDGDQILLVRGHGRPHWHLPGGAVKRGETLQEGAAREVREETGCEVEIERLLGMYANFSEYKSDHIAIFVAHPISQMKVPFNIEIAEARFFPLTQIPREADRSVRARLADYQAQNWGMYGPWRK